MAHWCKLSTLKNMIIREKIVEKQKHFRFYPEQIFRSVYSSRKNSEKLLSYLRLIPLCWFLIHCYSLCSFYVSCYVRMIGGHRTELRWEWLYLICSVLNVRIGYTFLSNIQGQCHTWRRGLCKLHLFRGHMPYWIIIGRKVP